MKKVTILIAFLFAALFSYSQDTKPTYERVTKLTKYEYVSERLVEREVLYPKDLYISIDGYRVKLNNDLIITHGLPKTEYHEGFVSYTWDCVNTEGAEGFFIMKKFTDYKGMVYMLGTGNWCYEYITE